MTAWEGVPLWGGEREPEGGRRTQGKREESAAHSKVQGRRERGNSGLENRGGGTEKDRRLDLGLQDAPRSTTYTTDQTKARKGRTVRWHQETVHKRRHTAVPTIRPTNPPNLRTLIQTNTYLISRAISKIPRLSHATPERHSSRYSVHAGTLQSESGIFCAF